MRKSRLFTIHEFQLQRRDFENQLQSLRLQVEQRNIVVDASKLPALVGVVGAAGLEHGHWGEFEGCKLNLAFSEVESSDFASVLVTPLALILVPNGNLDFCGVFAHVDRLW